MFLPYLTIVIAMNFERSFEFKLPTIWTDEQAEAGRAREEKRREEKGREEKRREEKKKEDQRGERARRKKIREEKEPEERKCRCAKRQTSRETQCFGAPEGQKVGSLKRRVRSHLVG